VSSTPEGPLFGVRLARNGDELQWVERVRPISTALVYSAGYDGTFSALVVRSYPAC